MRLRTLLATLLMLCAAAASAEMLVVAGARSPLPELSRDTLEQLYLGRTRNLDDGTPVLLTDLPTGALRDTFYRKLTGKNPAQIRAHWSRMVFTGRALPPQEAADAEELRRWLAANPQMIGYLAPGDLDNRLRVLLRLP